ncbi:MAG TPA: SDR family oxidoreductase [Planctomycetota bacterium]|nr:SDR family oxidoreductase [Planctomycetota bacterium]
MRTALIAGASGTLGQAISRELLARGYQLGLHYHTRADACAALAASPGCKTYQADFRDPAAVQNLAAAFVKDFSRVDALVWAAGVVKDAPLLTLKEDDLRGVLDVDLKAPFLLLKALARQFLKQKSGAVVLLSSHGALAGRAGGSAYCMAHAGLLSLMKSLAREWGSSGIRVNSVVPPFVPESGMGRAATPEFIEAAKAKRALKVDTNGSAACARLVADALDNPAISGQVLSADSRVL